MPVTARRLLVLCEVGLVLAVLAAAVLTFSRSKAKTDGDEAEWIGTSRYFQTLFVDRDLSDEAWADSYWTRTQPMMARYVIGAWLWMRGYDLYSFNPHYNHDVSWSANQRAGRAPSEALLDEARRPMRALATLSVVVVYLVVRILAGPIGGLAAVGLFIGSPYLTEHLIRAKGDSTVILFLLLALLGAVVALRRTGTGRRRWGALAGAALGLAVGAKLTAVVAVAAVSLWGILQGIRAAVAGPRRPLADRLVRGVRDPCVTWTALVLVTAAVAFVASNPYLYRDPLGRTILMLQNRQYEMSIQAATEPYKAVSTPAERALLVLERGLLHETWGMSYTGWPVEAALAAVGFVWLALLATRRAQGPESFTLAAVICIFCGVAWGLGYRQQHYFLPPTLSGVVLAGVGAGAMFTMSCRVLVLMIRPVRAPMSRDVEPRQLSEALPVEG